MGPSRNGSGDPPLPETAEPPAAGTPTRALEPPAPEDIGVSPTGLPEPTPKEPLLVLLSILVSVGLAAVVYWWAGPGETLSVMGEVGVPGFLAYAAAVLGVLLLQTVGWDILLRVERIPVSFRSVSLAMLAGYAMSYITPSMYLGGEPARVLLVARASGVRHRRVAGTVILHKVAEFSGFVTAVTASTLIVFATPGAFGLPDSVRVVLIAGDAFFAGSFIYLLFSFATGRLISVGFLLWLARRVRPWKRACYRLAARTRGTEAVIHGAMRESPGQTALCFLLTGGSLIIVFLKPAIFFWMLRGHWPFTLQEMSVVFVLTQFILAFQITPGGLGIYEGGQVAAFALVGVAAPEAIAYATFVRAVDMALTAAGLGILSHFGMMSLARGGMPADDEGPAAGPGATGSEHGDPQRPVACSR